MPSGPPGQPHGRPGRSARARRLMPWWKRIHLPYIFALFLVLPIALGLPWWLEREKMMRQGAMPPVPTPASGPKAEVAGSTWEFRGPVVGEIGAQEPPPKGVQLVDAVFLVTPDDKRASDLLQSSCRFRAIDDQGRSWDPTTRYNTRQLPDGVGSVSFGCSDAEGNKIDAGAETGLVVSFLVPKDAVDSLSFEVRANTSTSASEPEPAAVLFDPSDAATEKN